MPTEADTCRTLILPKLYAAGWSDDQLSEQHTFTDGRIVVHGNRASAPLAKHPGRTTAQRGVLLKCQIFIQEPLLLLNVC